MDLKHRTTEQNKPICKFGPGGDYINAWPPIPTNQSTQANPLGNLLSKIAEIMGLDYANLNTENTKLASAGLIEDNLEVLNFGSNGIHNNAQTNAGLTVGGKISKEQMLFDDAPGTKPTTQTKPNHHVRTHRRTKRKKSAFGQPWQGTLFETNTQSTKVA